MELSDERGCVGESVLARGSRFRLRHLELGPTDSLRRRGFGTQFGLAAMLVPNGRSGFGALICCSRDKKVEKKWPLTRAPCESRSHPSFVLLWCLEKAREHSRRSTKIGEIYCVSRDVFRG